VRAAGSASTREEIETILAVRFLSWGFDSNRHPSGQRSFSSTSSR
jgi:hypothetical protein